MALPRQITPALLDALRMVESAGGKRLVSPAGALGPYQLMPATAKMYGVDPMDEKQSRWAAQAILEDNLERFGNLDTALMGYHAGNENVRKWQAGKPSGVGPRTLAYPGKIKTALGFPVDDAPVQLASTDPAAGFDAAPREEAIPAPDAVSVPMRGAIASAPDNFVAMAPTAAPRNGGKMTTPWAWMTGNAGGTAAAADDGDMIGLLSPHARFMALMQGLTQMGGRMSQPGGNFGTGLAGFGEGIGSGIQSGMQFGLLSDRLKEKAEKKKALAAIAADPKMAPYKDLLSVDPGSAIKLAYPAQKQAEPRKIGDIQTFQKGDKKITRQWTEQGWQDLGEGPAWQPHKPDKPESPFGNSPEGWSMRILQDPNADPNSENYSMAYWHMIQPKPMEVIGQDGSKTVTWQTPTLPPGIRRPAWAQQPAAAPAVGEGVPAAQPAPDQPPALVGTQAAPGMPTLTPAGPPQPPKMNDEQAKAALYADRMRASEGVISKVGEAGLSLKDRVASGLPGGNYLVSNEYQQLDQAQRDFINATLRRESGAVISDPEFDNARRQYFPQPGDSKETLEQKRRNRQLAIEGIARAAGPGYKPPAPAAGGDAPAPPPGFKVID